MGPVSKPEAVQPKADLVMYGTPMKLDQYLRKLVRGGYKVSNPVYVPELKTWRLVANRVNAIPKIWVPDAKPWSTK